MEDMVELWVYPGTYKRKCARSDSRLKRHKNPYDSPPSRKWHDIRFESTLSTKNGHGKCARKDLEETWIHDHDDDVINVEPNCRKCGWKILYNEAFVNTNSSKYDNLFYHIWCHSGGSD